MSTKRNKYTAAEKSKIALEAIKGELTLSQITAKYGVHATQITAWKKQLLAYLPEAFTETKKREKTEHEAQLGELYEQIGRLKIENDFLKKNLRCSMETKRAFVETNHPLLSVRQQCELLAINRSGLYYTPRPKIMNEKQLALLRLVDEIYTHYPFFGTRQMSDYLSLHHQPCKRHETRWAYEHS